MSATMPDILSNHHMATILGGIRSGEIRLQNVHTKDGKIYTIENYRCDDINHQLNFHFRSDIGYEHFSIKKEYPFEIRKNEDGTYDFYQQEFKSKGNSTYVDQYHSSHTPRRVEYTLSHEDFNTLEEMCEKNSFKGYSEWVTTTPKPITFIDENGRRFTIKHFQCELPVFNGIYHGSTTPGFLVSFNSASIISSYQMGIEHFKQNYKWDIPSGTIYHRTYML